MKKLLLFLSWLSLSANLFAQPLSFAELGSDPAYCRLYSYQSGNGVVYAWATGGTPDYSYQWTNLQTGATTTNTTWGGLNPGLYKIVVTDDGGGMLVDTVVVDSLNPIANFQEVLGNLNPAPFGYTGFMYEDAKFVNTSLYFANPNNPTSDTTFFWNMGVSGSWDLSQSYFDAPEQGYYAGDYDVSLVAINKNGCADTLSKHIHIFGPVGIEAEEKSESYLSIYSKPQQNLLHFTCEGFSEKMFVTIFSINGEKILTFEAEAGNNEVAFTAATGIYTYLVVGATTQNTIATGKLKH